MGDAGIKPDVIAYTTAIKVIAYPLESRNEHILFMELLVHLKGTFHSHTILKITCLLTDAKFSSFGLQVCVESKNFKQALTLYEEMKSCEIHPNWVSSIMLCF